MLNVTRGNIKRGTENVGNEKENGRKYKITRGRLKYQRKESCEVQISPYFQVA
jgi:hypothetical protein